MSPSIQAYKSKMPTIVFTTSPVPMPYSASPVYSQRLPSKTPIYSQRPPSKAPSYRPHIMPIQKADMIPSYSPTPTVRASPTQMPIRIPLQFEEHSLMILSLQAVGALGFLIFCFMAMWVINNERRNKRNANAKQNAKAKGEFTKSELIIQQINPTAYSKLNLIRRASSNSLNSSGSLSPV